MTGLFDRVMEDTYRDVDNYASNLEKSLNRLRKEYEEHGSLVVAFDFDNTIYDYHDAGLDMSTTVAVLKAAHEIGMDLFCFTANVDHELVTQHVTKVLGIEDIAINKSKLDHLFDSRKPFYSILLDDRAGLDNALTDLAILVDEINKNMLTNS